MSTLPKLAANGKVIGEGARKCNACGKVLPFSAFYVRSGYGTQDAPAIEPGHFTTECKACMKQRSKGQLRLPPWETLVKSEELAIKALMEHGIWAQTGKATQAPDVDVVAFSAVWIECKHAVLTRRGFKFSVTPKQQERGYMGHIVMLICEWPGQRYTHHLFDADAPYFYHEDGRAKTGFVFVPGKRKATTRGRGNQWQLTQPVMDAAQDQYELIWSYLAHIRQALLDGRRPEYGKVFK